MINKFIGKKINITQKFTKEGERIPVTLVEAGDLVIVQVKTIKKDSYSGLQLAFLGKKDIKKVNKPKKGHLKGANIKKAPLALFEVKIDKESEEKFKKGDLVKVSEVLKTGDKVKVFGTSKGKGFTGVMKRWGFAGGPRTHGQSDRERAPGSIGQGTDPGRVHKGKKMPGRSGGERVKILGLTVALVDQEKNLVGIKGLVPGAKGSLVGIEKEGCQNKKFTSLLEDGRIEVKEESHQKAKKEKVEDKNNKKDSKKEKKEK